MFKTMFGQTCLFSPCARRSRTTFPSYRRSARCPSASRTSRDHNIEKLEPYYSKYRNSFSHVIGFRPTGWTYSAPSGTDQIPSIPNLIARSQSRNFTAASLNLMRNSNSQYQLYGVPYSEHSSFFELTAFALSIDVGKIIATVNVGTAKSRGMMSKWFEKWDVERKKRVKEKKETILPYRSLDYW